MEDLTKKVEELNIQSIAIPPLGAGLGGLDWNDVRARIIKSFENFQNVKVLLYEPQGSPEPDKIRISTSKPNMTKGRALLIKLLDLYQKQGYRHSLLEIQKLMYFMQHAGEDLRLKFVKYKYGPYAENLNHVLQRIDGHYIRGYGDRKSRSEIYLLNGVVQEADDFLSLDNDVNQRLKRVRRLISGFETPYGLELLSTVHWIVSETPECKDNTELLISEIQSWSQRKKLIIKPHHVSKALRRFETEGWFTPSA